MIVKVFQTSSDSVATIVTKDGNIRYNVVLDESLKNKMCRRPRAYFESAVTDGGEFALFKRLPDQGW